MDSCTVKITYSSQFLNIIWFAHIESYSQNYINISFSSHCCNDSNLHVSKKIPLKKWALRMLHFLVFIYTKWKHINTNITVKFHICFYFKPDIGKLLSTYYNWSPNMFKLAWGVASQKNIYKKAVGSTYWFNTQLLIFQWEKVTRWLVNNF